MSPPPQANLVPAAHPVALGETDDSTSVWFRQEVYLHDRQLRAYLRGSFPAVRDVEDVVQESYLRIWKARLAHPIRSTKDFLFQVARNLAISALRRRQTAATDSLGDLASLTVMDDRRDAADQLCYAERVELLAAAFLHLPPRCREIMTLRKLKGLPNREIALKLGISEGTVENQITRGVHLLRTYLRNHKVLGFSRE